MDCAKFGHHTKKWARRNWLLLFTLCGVITGIWLGFVMRLAEFSKIQRYYWAFPGDVILMNMLKCIVIPLITLSITTGVASLAKNSGRISFWAMTYYMTTTFLAIILGIVMNYIVRPGKFADKTKMEEYGVDFKDPSKQQNVVNGLLDIVRNCFPPNIVSALFQQASTKQITVNQLNKTDGSVIGTYEDIVVSWTSSPTQNVLGLIVFFSVFGYLLGKLAHQGNKGAQDSLRMMNGLNDAVMELVDLVMWYLPVGLVFLISNKIMSVNDTRIWTALGWLIFTTTISILIHGLIIIPRPGK